MGDIIIFDEFGNLDLLFSNFLTLFGMFLMILLAIYAAKVDTFANAKENLFICTTFETRVSDIDCLDGFDLVE